MIGVVFDSFIFMLLLLRSTIGIFVGGFVDCFADEDEAGVVFDADLCCCCLRTLGSSLSVIFSKR